MLASQTTDNTNNLCWFFFLFLPFYLTDVDLNAIHCHGQEEVCAFYYEVLSLYVREFSWCQWSTLFLNFSFTAILLVLHTVLCKSNANANR